MDMGPLLDCVLQLLIFFMLSTTFMSPKVSIALPDEIEKSQSDGTAKNDSVRISADKDGRIFVNQKEVEPNQLEQKLREALKKSPERKVLYYADKNSSYGLYMKVVNAARKAGAKKFDQAHDTRENK